MRKFFTVVVTLAILFVTGCDLPEPVERRGGLTKEQAYTNVANEVIVGKIVVNKSSKKRPKKSRRYYLHAKDGSSLRVSKSEYDKAIIGQPWYSSQW